MEDWPYLPYPYLPYVEDCPYDDGLVRTLVSPIVDEGFTGLRQTVEMLLNMAMKYERERHLQAKSYERTPDRIGYANGFKPRTLNTRVGKLNLQVPQTRGTDFYPKCLEHGMRSERALYTAMAEMYIQGVAQRNVRAILEKTCGLEVSAMQVSDAVRKLDSELEKWRMRPLAEPCSYMLLDARYEKVRVDGVVADMAVLIAYAITPSGHRRVLGSSVMRSEAEVHWRRFLESLVQRGLHGLKMIVSDNHPGLRNARMTVFPSVPWQRCQFHLQQNATAHVPKKHMLKEVHDDIRNVFSMPTLEEAKLSLDRIVKKYSGTCRGLADWLETEIPQGFTVYSVIPSQFDRIRLRTTNMVEFENKELKKRTRCIRVFPNEASLLRLVTALLVELDEKWSSDTRAYVSPVQADGNS